jgi:hypothetical protein
VVKRWCGRNPPRWADWRSGAVLTDHEIALIARLHPDTRAAYNRYRGSLASLGIEEIAYSTVRTAAQQAEKLKAGKSANKRSWHEIGRGVDRFLRRLGQIEWNKGSDTALYREANMLAEREGWRQISFKPDGSKMLIGPKKIFDCGHIEWRRPYATLEEALAAELVT